MTDSTQHLVPLSRLRSRADEGRGRKRLHAETQLQALERRYCERLLANVGQYVRAMQHAPDRDGRGITDHAPDSVNGTEVRVSLPWTETSHARIQALGWFDPRMAWTERDPDAEPIAFDAADAWLQANDPERRTVRTEVADTAPSLHERIKHLLPTQADID